MAELSEGDVYGECVYARRGIVRREGIDEAVGRVSCVDYLRKLYGSLKLCKRYVLTIFFLFIRF